MPPQPPVNDRNGVTAFVTDLFIEGFGTIFELIVEVGGGIAEIIAALFGGLLDGLG